MAMEINYDEKRERERESFITPCASLTHYLPFLSHSFKEAKGSEREREIKKSLYKIHTQR
jgi:hypothetical protein